LNYEVYKLKKNNKIECSEIENILIQAHFEVLTKQESLKIKEHLKSCPSCKKYASILKTLSNTLQKETITDLAPDPKIRLKLIKNLPQKQKVASGITEIAKGILAYRVPVYQIIAAFVIIFATVFVINPNPTSRTLESKPLDPYSEEQLTVNVFDSLQILHSKKIGKNIHEDSVLTSWFVTF
jgi:uncharacterized protein YjgD (DUF1641 family)